MFFNKTLLFSLIYFKFKCFVIPKHGKIIKLIKIRNIYENRYFYC